MFNVSLTGVWSKGVEGQELPEFRVEAACCGDTAAVRVVKRVHWWLVHSWMQPNDKKKKKS